MITPTFGAVGSSVWNPRDFRWRLRLKLGALAVLCGLCDRIQPVRIGPLERVSLSGDAHALAQKGLE